MYTNGAGRELDIRLQDGPRRNCVEILDRPKKFLSSLYCPDQQWGPSSLFFNRYTIGPISCWVWSGCRVNLTIHPHKVPRRRMILAIIALPYAFVACVRKICCAHYLIIFCFAMLAQSVEWKFKLKFGTLLKFVNYMYVYTVRMCTYIYLKESLSKCVLNSGNV